MSRVTISMKAARAIDAYLEWSRQVEVEPALTRTAAVPLSDWFELRRAMEPKRKPRKPSAKAPRPGEPGAPLSIELSHPMQWTSQATRDAKKAQKRDRRASIREAVFKRAGGRCEGPGPEAFSPTAEEYGRCPSLATDLLRIFGRGKGRRPESEQNCLAACRTCHDMETRNQPDGTWWWDFFAEKLADFGFHDESGAAWKRAHFERTRSMLGASVQQRHRDAAEESIQKLEEKVKHAVEGGGE